MYKFPDLLKKIREESGLTQVEFAKALGVSTILISMLEVGQKPASKKFVAKLASKLHVHPSAILPSIFTISENQIHSLSKLERSLLELGKQLQSELIKTRAKNIMKICH